MSFLDAADFGFSPDASGVENTRALQCAADRAGTIVVSRPGTYKVAGTVYIGSHTSLVFGNNVFVKKVDEQGPFTHVFLNKGALTRTYDEHIEVEGLYLIVNGIDVCRSPVDGLRGQVAFFYVRDLRIHRFRCMDLGSAQFCLHVCTFEDVIIDDVVIRGKKDGVHFGRGKRFTVRNGVFQTYDDAIALNAHDYVTSNPELGWIEHGVVEHCHDLEADSTTGFFCRILAGAWTDWREDMEVRFGDSVISNHQIYRVRNKAAAGMFRSATRPTHASGSQVLDDIEWLAVQTGEEHTAGVRNVLFRDIFLEKGRIGFSVHFDNGRYSRSYYPGAPIPQQERLTFENIQVLHAEPVPLLSISSPVDAITILNSSFKNGGIEFDPNGALDVHPKTAIQLSGCTFGCKGPMDLLTNKIDRKEVVLKTSSSIELHGDFEAKVIPGNGHVTVESDLRGLRG